MTSNTAVLLDIDGTLIDSNYLHTVAWHRGFRSCGTTVPMWRLHRSIGMGGDRLVARVAGEEIEQRQGDQIRAAWRKEYAGMQAEVFPLPGSMELVRSIGRSPHRVALASSGDPEFTDNAVALLGIGDVVELVTSADDAEASKPASDLLQVALERMGGINSAVFVGDTPYDVEAAVGAGMRCVTVRTGGFSTAELRDSGADLVVDSPADLIGLDWSRYLP